MIKNMKALREKRISQGMTGAEVAAKVGISTMHYWYIENEQRSLKLDLAKKIAKAVNADPKEIFFNE